jgi:phosphocarrier protein
MEESPIKSIGSFIVSNKKGLHTRPATELVKCASGFKSQITLTFQSTTVSAKSILGILMLAASKGSKIRIEAQGSDAPGAVATLIDLANSKFNIHY